MRWIVVLAQRVAAPRGFGFLCLVGCRCVLSYRADHAKATFGFETATTIRHRQDESSVRCALPIAIAIIAIASRLAWLVFFCVANLPLQPARSPNLANSFRALM